MKKLLLSFLLLALVLPAFGQNQDEFKFSLVPRRVSVPSVTGFIRDNGTVPLTANWLGNAYQISRLVPVLALTDGATQTISAAQCQNYVIHNGSCTQAIEMDLPAAAVGMQITVYVVAAYTVALDPNGTDQIMVYTGTAGDKLTSDAVAGTAISLICLQVNKWHIAGATGSWTEE